MFEAVFVMAIGIMGGMAVGIQSPVVASMANRVGGAAGSFIVHLSGMLFSMVLLLLRGGEQIRDWQRLPWYMLASGLFGLILVQSINVTLPRLGGTVMITLIIIGQLLMGVLVDHFGWFGVTVHPASLTRVLGVVVLLLGGYLVAR